MTTQEIKFCPFRTYSEVRPALTMGSGDITVQGFMECLKGDCPAWYSKTERIPASTVYQEIEHCKRLER